MKILPVAFITSCTKHDHILFLLTVIYFTLKHILQIFLQYQYRLYYLVLHHIRFYYTWKLSIPRINITLELKYQNYSLHINMLNTHTHTHKNHTYIYSGMYIHPHSHYSTISFYMEKWKMKK